MQNPTTTSSPEYGYQGLPKPIPRETLIFARIQADPFSAPRAELGACSIGGTLYAFGGIDDAGGYPGDPNDYNATEISGMSSVGNLETLRDCTHPRKYTKEEILHAQVTLQVSDAPRSLPECGDSAQMKTSEFLTSASAVRAEREYLRNPEYQDTVERYNEDKGVWEIVEGMKMGEPRGSFGCVAV